MSSGFLLGQIAKIDGDVTRLKNNAGLPPSILEKSLGYGVGRLGKGYWIALLNEPLLRDGVIFGGLTLRSGGREGLPLHDPIADAKRIHNHQRFIQEFGQDVVDRELDELIADPANLKGSKRIIKILPVVRHVGADPAVEYPMGGGAPQFTLTKLHSFKIAAFVDSRAMATTLSSLSVDLADLRAYDKRGRFVRYLETA